LVHGSVSGSISYRFREVAAWITGVGERLEQNALGSAEGPNRLETTLADAVIDGPA
jgi:hypothetical protein